MLEIEINVVCAKCGSNLLASLETNRFVDLIAEIQPCEDCLDVMWEAGHEAGYDEGFAESRSENEV